MLLRPTEPHHAVRIALIYVAAGSVWIVLTDALLGSFVSDVTRLTQLQTLKGWLYVGLSGGLVFLLVRSAVLSLSRLETGLREREQLLRQVGEHTNAAIWAYQRDEGRLLYLSPSAERILGRSLTEIYRRPDYLLNQIHSADRALVTEATYSTPCDEEYPVTRGDGDVRWLRTLSSAIQDERGRYDRIVGVTEDITQAKRAEQALHDSEQRFRATFEQAAVGMAHVDPNGEWLRVNQRLCEITGFSQADLLGRTFQSITHPEDVESDSEQVIRLWLGEISTYSKEKRYIRKDGSVVWVNLTASLVRGPSGEPKYVVTVIEDIDERKRAEFTTRESEARFRQLAENIPQVFWIRSIDMEETVYVSPAYDAVWGWPREALQDHPRQWLDVIHPEDRARIETALPRQIMGTYDEEYRIVRQDGAVRSIRDRAFPIHDDRGEIHRLIGIAEDVTHSRRRDEELMLLASAIAQAGEGVLITDANGVIQYVNPAFEAVTGYARNEILGENPRMLKSGKYDEAYYRRMWHTLLSGDPVTARITNRRKDGQLYTQDSVITPVRSGGDEITHMVAVLRDVTHEIALETQLRQSQKLEAIGRLAGGIAHDFNNVLTVITGHVQFALDDLDNSNPSRTDLGHILAAVERAQNLTRQLLAFSRQQVIEPRVLDTGDVIRSAETMLRQLIGEDITLDVILTADVGRVRADPTQIDQVLVNLAVNARDAMPQGGRLAMTADNVVLRENFPGDAAEPVIPGRYVRIRVADTGSGMDAATREKIFEPFFTTKPAGRGTGLGLSTVFGIVKQGGGYIRVNSAIGFGAIFEIYLPRTDDEAEPSTRDPVEPGRSTGSATILLVEDQQAVRAVVRRGLERAGYQVCEAEDGRAALEVWEREAEAIDLVLTDMVMPYMGGRQLAEVLRARNPALPILFMSGYAEGEILQRGVLEPGMHMIEKPFDGRRLQQKVCELLAHASAAE